MALLLFLFCSLAAAYFDSFTQKTDVSCSPFILWEVGEELYSTSILHSEWETPGHTSDGCWSVSSAEENIVCHFLLSFFYAVTFKLMCLFQLLDALKRVFYTIICIVLVAHQEASRTPIQKQGHCQKWTTACLVLHLNICAIGTSNVTLQNVPKDVGKKISMRCYLPVTSYFHNPI